MTSNQLTAIARGEANTSFAFSTRFGLVCWTKYTFYILYLFLFDSEVWFGFDFGLLIHFKNYICDCFRNTVEAKWVRQIKMSSPNPNVKKANLSATKKERIELPINYDYDGNCGSKAKAYHISEFLSHPSGIQAMLNTSALQSFQFLDTNTYRSTLYFPFHT